MLIDQGILPRAGRAGHDLDKVTLTYIQHLRDQASGRGDGAASATLSAARSRLTEVKAAQAEFEHRVATDEFVHAADCIEMLRDTFAVMKATFLGTAGKIADIGANRSREELFTLIDAEHREALSALADPASYVRKKK